MCVPMFDTALIRQLGDSSMKWRARDQETRADGIRKLLRAERGRIPAKVRTQLALRTYEEGQ